MSVQVISEVKRRVIPGGATAKLLLLCLADYADSDWSCWPSQERLAGEVQVSVRSLNRHLGMLKDAGLVTSERRMDGQRRLSDLLTIDHDALLALPLAVSGPVDKPLQKTPKDTEPEHANLTHAKSEHAKSRRENMPNRVDSGADTTCLEPSVEPSVSAAAAAGPDPELSTSTAEVVPIKPTDPTKTEARRLAQLAFEQTPKPVCRGGFIGVMKLLQQFLKAGHDSATLELAIANGHFKTWTLAAMTVALDKASPGGGRNQPTRNVYLDMLNGTSP